jgi:hypothetical protein
MSAADDKASGQACAPEVQVEGAVATLERARAYLVRRLAPEPAWNAWCQLEAREKAGERLAVVTSEEMRQRLGARLDAAVPGWRQLAGLEAAIAALRSATPAVAGPEPGLAATGAGARATAPAAGAAAAGMPPQVSQAPPAPAPSATAPAAAEPAGTKAPLPATPDRPVVPLEEPVATRNRSLVEALGAMQAIASGPETALPAAVPADPAAMADEADAEAVLRRIRTLGPATPDKPAVVVHREPAAWPTPGGPGASSLTIARATPAPPAASPLVRLPARPAPLAVSEAPRTAPPPLPGAGAHAKPVATQGPVQAASGPAAVAVPASPAALDGIPAAGRRDRIEPASPREGASADAAPPTRDPDTDGRAPGAAALGGAAAAASAERVAALEVEIERFMQRSAGMPRPAPRQSLADAATQPGERVPTAYLEEAEIEIIAVERQPDADDDPGDDSGQPSLLTPRHRDRPGTASLDSDSYAAYRDIVDEASVEIVRFDRPGGRPLEPERPRPPEGAADSVGARENSPPAAAPPPMTGGPGRGSR